MDGPIAGLELLDRANVGKNEAVLRTTRGAFAVNSL
jgi:hypothetical protein